MWKRIGIVGGISHESTAAYYQRLHARYYQLEGNYHYPEVIVYSLDFQRFTDLEEGDDRQATVDYILTGLRALERAGADLGLMAANSPHAVYGDLEALSPLPLISIVEVTAREAARLGLGRLLLLGIRFTMEGSFYAEAFRQQGLAIVTPDTADRELINSIIFEELVVGRVEASSRQRLLEIIGRYDVEGVILGCTELPLLLKEGDAAAPLLNTLDLHVEAALDLALGRL